MTEKLALLGGDPVRTRPFHAWPVFGDAEEQELLETLRSGKWGRLDGQQVERFEKRFAEFHNAAHAVAVNNGTVALRIALLAAGIQAGDEVIVPPYTFLATATAVIECNAMPIFADVDLDTFCLDPEAAEAVITPRTKAIIPVHLGGCPAAMDEIRALARKHRLLVIEDAAQAHGAQYKGLSVGTLGDLATFSFQSSKNLTCGEGGMILTNSEKLASQCRCMHNCGRIPGGAWYEHHLLGGNYRLMELQGALLNAQFDRFADQAGRREKNGKYLAERLAELPGITPQKRGPEITRHAYHLFLFRIDAGQLGVSRARFLEALEAEGVPACEGYVMPLYKQPLFENRAFGPYTGWRSVRPDSQYSAVECPNCERLCAGQAAWIEQRLFLGTQQDMDDIFGAFEKVYDNRETLRDQVPV